MPQFNIEVANIVVDENSLTLLIENNLL